ncbi:unnamed protein product [Effrenium voratum]|nr:unnamed protein product [Effrenium voratum]
MHALSGELLGTCSAASVQEVKTWAAEKLRIPAWEQRILLDGRALEDAELCPGPAELQLLRLDSSWASSLRLAQEDGELLGRLPEACREDRDIVMAAVQSRGQALRFASESLQNDREVVFAAVSQDGHALKFAETFQTDRKVVLAAVLNNGLSLQHAPDFRTDLEITAAAIQEDQRALSLVPQDMWLDCFEVAQRASSQQLQRSAAQCTTCGDFALVELIRYLPCCFGGLVGCLVAPVLAAGLALPPWVALLGSGTAGLLAGARITHASERNEAYTESSD